MPHGLAGLKPVGILQRIQRLDFDGALRRLRELRG
jgi:hypothetical protein